VIIAKGLEGRAHLHQLLKKGSKVKVNNNRPVCLTSVIVKVLESIVKDALLLRLTQHNILSDKQHGFIPCCTQLLHTLNDWTSALDHCGCHLL